MIEFTQSGTKWTLCINRPDKANSLTKDMLVALVDHVSAAQDAGAQVLILTGTGKVFSAGADLDEARAGLAKDPVWEELSGRIAAFPGLSIAALNGTLAGGAFGMALACDMRLSVPNAKFFYPAIKLGFLPQPSDPPRMRALIGPSRTKAMLMAAEKIAADTALAWGLIDEIVDADAMADRVNSLSEHAMTAPPAVVGGIKALIDE